MRAPNWYQNESQRDHRRSDENGAADVARGRARFTGENRHVFKSAQRADRELGENIEAIEERHRRAARIEADDTV